MKIKTIAIIAVAIAVAAAVVAVVYTGRGAAATEGVEADEAAKVAVAQPVKGDAKNGSRKASAKAGRMPGGTNVKKQAMPRPRVTTDERDDLTPEEKRQMTAIEEAMDEENLEKLRAILPAAAASKNTEIRSELVDGLGWFGKKAMNELLQFMADPDEDIRESAVDNWTSALSEIEDDKTRADIVESAMMVVTDENALDSMTSELTGIDEKLALQVIINVVESGKAPPEAAAAAREEYEFITGEEYTNVDDANKWMSENYSSPEAEGESGKE